MCSGEGSPRRTDGGRPAESGHGEASASETTREWAVAAAEEIRVLHVDDEPALLEVTGEFLQQEDERIAVETTTSPEEALTMLDGDSFDVVVSDHQMGEMTGLELLERIREGGSRIPFIIFTGRGREEVAVDALNLGADRYLQKGGHPKSQYGLLADAIVQESAHRRAREELRESEERYRTLVEAFPDIVFITDYDSQMLWANDALERQTGLTIDDFQMDQEDNPFIHPEDTDHVAARIGEFVESSRTYSDPIDNRFIDADGDVHWYSSIVAKVTYDGDPALQFITRNISDRKEREQRLQRVQRRYRTFLDAFPDGIVALFDGDCRYIDVGGELLTDAGFSAADIEGERVADVNTPILSAVDVDDCRAVFDGTSLSRTTTFDGRSVEIRLRPVADDDAVTAGLVVSVPA
jgi:PAS domain S-box-containing protein